MGIYEKYFLPKLINFAMKAPEMTKIRRNLVPLAEGKVLEIGVGSGLNLPFYPAGSQVTALDPSLELQAYAREVAGEAGLDVEFVAQSGEDMPFDDNSFDTVVMTWTLCSIPEPMKALSEMRRVLRPGGKVLFSEHGKAPDANVAKWQDRINGFWGVIGGGCNLNRPMENLYRNGGFELRDVDRGYIKGPRVATYTIRGVAQPA